MVQIGEGTVKIVTSMLYKSFSLQTLLGVHDLGMLHYHPIKDQHTGSIVFPLVQKIPQPKIFSGCQNLKWTTLAKVYKHSSSHDCIIPLLEVSSHAKREHPPLKIIYTKARAS